MTIATLIEKFQEDISWLGYTAYEREIIEHMKCAIHYLKEQEPKTVQSIRTVAQRSYGYCPSCGRGLDSYQDSYSGEHITHFCYNCGQALKWDA